MQLRVRHAEFLLHAVKAELAVGSLKRQRMLQSDFLLGVLVIPFIHAPEVAVFDRYAEIIDQTRHQRELLRGPDRPANARRIVRRGLLPGVDVLQRLGQVKVLQGVKHHHFEAGAGELAQIPFSKPGGIVDKVIFQRGVVPPLRCDMADFTRHGLIWLLRE